MAERALYKFLEANLACPVTGLAWPAPAGATPGAWVERASPFDPDGLGFLVFRDHDLAPWASTQLFLVEVAGSKDEDDSGVVISERVRLVAPEPKWPAIVRELAALALSRVNALVPSSARLAEYAGDVAGCVEHGMVNGFLFIAALAHAVAVDPHAGDAAARHTAFMHERALQSRLIAERLAG